MTDIHVGAKIHKNLESYSITQLEHVRQQARDAAVNYKKNFTHALQPYQQRYYDDLLGRVKAVEAILASKRKS